jgi:hypothetical protein
MTKVDSRDRFLVDVLPGIHARDVSAWMRFTRFLGTPGFGGAMRESRAINVRCSDSDSTDIVDVISARHARSQSFTRCRPFGDSAPTPAASMNRYLTSAISQYT